MSTSGATDVDAIRHRAYQLWNEDGCPEGRAVEYWLRAEAELGTGESEAAPSLPQAADEPAAAPRPARGAAKAKPASKTADETGRRESLGQQRRPRSKAEG